MKLHPIPPERMRFGAPMGRTPYGFDHPGRLYVSRVPLDSGGYDPGGVMGYDDYLVYLATMEKQGDKFGRWTVMGLAPRKFYGKKGVRMVRCRCECGNTRDVPARDLRHGKSKSCGCYASRVAAERNTRHGMSKTAIYFVWKGIMRRCTDPKSVSWPWYGGRTPDPVRVCERWMNFQHFFDDIGRLYEKGKTIDRIDPRAGYEPGNCRWITLKQQQRNKRSNRMVRIDGGTAICMTEAAERMGINVHALKRLLNNGYGSATVNGCAIEDERQDPPVWK